MIDINTLRFEVQLNKLDNSQLTLSPLVIEDLLDRIEAAEKLNEKLREALAEKVASETMLRDLSVGNGHINASFEGGAVHLLVDAFANQFVESSATNYLEMQFHSNVTGPLVVTLQRLNGRTPHQLRAEAEKERDTLRAKIEQMEQQEPVGWFARIDGDGPLMECKHADISRVPLYALPGAQPAPSAPSEEAAAEMGANGGHVVEAERLAFEAWMRGHCWKLGAKWTGTEYRSAFEKGGMVDMHAMRTRELWAAWRDRAALAAAPEAKP